jgi:hypothetical protein
VGRWQTVSYGSEQDGGVRVGLGAQTYGGRSRFGRLSISISPSFGGGMRRSGGHDVMLCGVFQGTVGGETGSVVVVAWRRAGVLRRH